MRTFHVVVSDYANGSRQVDIVEDPDGESVDLEKLETYIRNVPSGVYSKDEVEKLLQILEMRRAEQARAL